MICGSFSLDGHNVNAEQVAAMADNAGRLEFYPVTGESFSGGYFLNSRLPLLSSDFLWHDQASGLLVLLSGRIHNRKELNGLINSAGNLPDPELAGRLFLLNGPDFVSGLNGDFAIFISRLKEREAWLYRDHVGIRPLVYYAGDRGLSFSTDIVSFSSFICREENPDPDYLSGYFRYLDYRLTPCRKVTKLLPGHYLHFTSGGYRLVKYWHPEKTVIDRSHDHESMLEGLVSLINDAVRIRCDNRYNAGAHVSSGLDSGVVAAIARQEYAGQEPFCGFSWSPESYPAEGLRFDERVLVEKLCVHNNILPHFLNLSTDGFREAVERFSLNQGFFWEEAVLRQAVAEGINLLFSGWGGDEFVSTAAPSIETDLLRGLKLRLLFRRYEIRKPLRFLKNVMRYIVMPALGIHDRGTAKSLHDDARYLLPQWKRSDRKAVRQFYFHTSRRSHHLGMLQFYHLQDRCEKWFVMGYRHGVEYRYPLLDRRIIEFMLKVPSELLCKTDYFRPLLREVGAGLLPEEVRLNTSKSDPVYREQMNDFFRHTAAGLMEEAGRWRENHDLGFIDFNRLFSDIDLYLNGNRTADDDRLFRGIVRIKALDGFTKAYRGKRV